MKIIENRLYQDDDTPIHFVPSPNLGGTLIPDMLIVHFTAGQSEAGAIQWMINRQSRAASHILIGKTGTITQLVPFNRIAYHAGTSSWKGRSALNRYAIGIELDNPGQLKRSGTHWVSWFLKQYPDEEVLVAKHKYGARIYGWPLYPPAQIEAAAELAALLVRYYRLTELLGHDDVSRARKWDPGPAFPMEDFRTEVLRRASDNPV